MGAAADKLTSLVRSPERFNYNAADVRATQIEALSERFHERKDCLKLLAHRAVEHGSAAILPARALRADTTDNLYFMVLGLRGEFVAGDLLIDIAGGLGQQRAVAVQCFHGSPASREGVFHRHGE